MSTSTSSPPPTHDGNSFVCECDEWVRSACAGEIFYKEHDGKRYCVLHYPGAEKKEDFQKALERKLNEQDFDFSGVWFPDDVSFQNLTFSANANFYKAQFSADADFSDAQFSTYADFRNAQFSVYADFRNAQFSADVYFSDAQFRAYADFYKAQFSADADFVNAQFSAYANFYNAQFSADVYFSDAQFSADVYFSDAQFSKNANFINAQFSADVYFSDAQFSAYANFSNVQFSADADFSDAQFKANASFFHAQFSAQASFRDAVFNGNVYFQSTAFIEEDGSPGRSTNSNNKASPTDTGNGADTSNIKFSFNGARFKDGVSFEENKFASRGLLSFAAAVFEKPERVTFHTVALRPHWFIDVDSRKLNFINVDWGPLHRRDAVREEIEALERGHVANAPRLLAVAFRQLAVNAEENNRYEEATNFRYLAMEVRRIERGPVENLFSLGWWYWALSGYGERVRRAFAALLVIWLLFALFYRAGDATWWQPKQASRSTAETGAGERQPDAVTERPATPVAQALTLPDALIYSLGVMTLQKPEPLPANRRARALVLMETILGPLQAALLALAIRRKFMR